jgi:hypothetical protein
MTGRDPRGPTGLRDKRTRDHIGRKRSEAAQGTGPIAWSINDFIEAQRRVGACRLKVFQASASISERTRRHSAQEPARAYFQSLPELTSPLNSTEMRPSRQ